jgi:hypothetical protein
MGLLLSKYGKNIRKKFNKNTNIKIRTNILIYVWLLAIKNLKR